MVFSAHIVHKVECKANQEAKQFFSQVVRRWQRQGSKKGEPASEHTFKVGDAISLDYCPKQIFVIAEIESFLRECNTR